MGVDSVGGVFMSDLIIHDECGLDIELCVCPDAPFYWDNDKGCIVERKKPVILIKDKKPIDKES